MTHYHSDRWTLADDLGIAHAGDNLARMLLLADLPFAVRVTGKWGAGKTSLLRRAFATLGGNPIAQAVPLGSERFEYDKPSDNSVHNLAGDVRYKKLGWDPDVRLRRTQSLPIWYSPWQHQNADNPLVPLLREICLQYRGGVKIREDSSKTFRQNALAGLTLLERVVDAGMTLFTGRNVKVASGTTKAVGKALDDGRQLEKLSDGQRFHLLFEDAVENALESLARLRQQQESDSKNARMVIFIDDLDRCDEATVVSMLECIKLYLETKRCVFVFGIDDNAVARALRHHWDGRSDHDNREYLEKLFQATVVVPQPKPEMVCKLIAAQFEKSDIPDPEMHARDMVALLEPNPRKLKNFANTLCANWQMIKAHKPATEATPSAAETGNQLSALNLLRLKQENQFFTRFMITIYLRVCHRHVWRVIEHEPATFPLLRHVLTGDGSKDPKLTSSQPMVRHLFNRAFFHVLKALPNEIEEKKNQSKHRDLDLQNAVDRFIDCVDQKRSDSHLIELFLKATRPDTALDQVLLYLPPDQEQV